MVQWAWPSLTEKYFFNCLIEGIREVSKTHEGPCLPATASKELIIASVIGGEQIEVIASRRVSVFTS